jgi:Cu(I)-responsive transcriptional regulator
MSNAYPMNIGEAARASGVSAKMIRHYEEIGLIRRAARSASGYRRYGHDDVHTLRFAHRARELGFSLQQIAELLSLWQNTRRASSRVKALCLAHVAEIDARMRGLELVKRSLETLAARCHGDDRPHCPILEGLSATFDAPRADGTDKRDRPRRPQNLGARPNRAKGA